VLGIPWRVERCPWPADPIGKLHSLARLAWALRRARPDVILPYTMRPNVLCGLLWRLAGARLCVWNQRDAGLQRMGPRLERHVVARVPRFVANSLPARDFLVNELGLGADRVRLVSNGVELAPPLESRAGWRRRLGLGERDFAACMVANLHPFKDHATLLRAWRSVVDAEVGLGGRAVLVLAGKPFQPMAPLKALAADLGVARRVRFLGQVIDVAGLLAACDVAVLSSPREGMPNSVLEAMASGRAVAGTDNPGIRSVVGPVGVPFLAPPGDAPALAERILWLARDRTLRARIGESHRRRVAAEFPPERMCCEMAALLEEGLK
jgi:glycosyltransferase involved in cell wall biosynthesis